MKKLLIFLGIITFIHTQAVLAADSELSEAIKLYKTGNYTQCYATLNEIAKKDSGNALVYYYLGMSAAQIGREEEAVQNYSKAVTLSPKNSTLYRYAHKGMTCIEDYEKCNSKSYESPIDAFIQAQGDKKSTEKVKSDFERLKIENLMRDINRNKDIEPARFKEYKDFSSMNDATPTNDDIVAALKTLQRAGLSNGLQNNVSLLYAGSQEDPLYGMMGNSSINPQVMQSLLMNKMSLGF